MAKGMLSYKSHLKSFSLLSLYSAFKFKTFPKQIIDELKLEPHKLDLLIQLLTIKLLIPQ